MNFDQTIFQICTGNRLTNKEIVAKSYQSETLYLINLEDVENPFLTRKFGFIGELHKEIITNSRQTAYNWNWVITETQTLQGGSFSVDFFKVDVSDKLMPYYSFKNTMQWKYL